MRSGILWHLLVLLLGSCSIGTAQKFVFHRVDAEGKDGSNLTIRDIASDSLGYVWLATDQGVWRYDGTEMLSFSDNTRSQDIRKIIYTQQHDLIIACDEGLIRINPYVKNRQFKSFLHASELPSPKELHYPNDVFQDSKNRIWIAQDDGQLHVWDDGRLKKVKLSEACNSSEGTISIIEIKNEIIGVSAGKCIFKINDELRFDRIHVNGNIPDHPSLEIINGELIVYGGGIQKVDFSFTTDTVTLTDHPIMDMQILSILHGGGHYFYVGTAHIGLKRVDDLGGDLFYSDIYVANDPHRVNELPIRAVHAIHRDKENIWLGTDEGLALLQRRYFETVNSLPHSNTLAVYHDTPDTYVAMGDLYKIDNTLADPIARIIDYGRNYTVSSIQRQGDKLWFGTTTGHLLTFKNNRLSKDVDLTKRGGGIFHMKTDNRGNMWICQAPDQRPIVGIAKMNPGGYIEEYGPDKGLVERLLVVDQGKDGKLYAAGIGATSMLYNFNYEEDAFYNLSLPLEFEVRDDFEVHDLEVDDNGVVWLATTDGLIRYDLDRFTRIDLGPYTDTEIRGIAAVDDRNHWISTDTYGMLHYDGEQAVSLGEDAGLGSKISSYRSLNIDHRGRIWVGTPEGVVYTRNASPQPDKTARPLLLNLKHNGASVKPNKDGKYRIGDRGKVEFRIKSIDHPGKTIEYRYRPIYKIGAEPWQPMNSDFDVDLADLNEGLESIEVSAMNRIGHGWSDPLIIPLTVHRPWYRSVWAYGLLAALFIGAIWIFLRFNLSKLMRRIRKLESALAIREKEYELAKHEKIEDKHRLDLIFKLTEILKKESSEKEVIQSIGQALDKSFDLELIEIGIYDPLRDLIDYYGYDSSLDVTTEREESFEFKEHIGAYAIHNNEILLFQNYAQQHKFFVTPEDDEHPYASQIIIPFELKDGRKAILHIGTEDPGRFENRDVEMFQILTTMVDSIDIVRI